MGGTLTNNRLNATQHGTYGHFLSYLDAFSFRSPGGLVLVLGNISIPYSYLWSTDHSAQEAIKHLSPWEAQG